MKFPTPLHRWDLSPRQAIALQRRLADRVIESPLGDIPRLVAGGDAAFTEHAEIIAAWVVWDRIERRVVEEIVVRRPVRFPYVPGLLSFRESPALLTAARRLKCEPGLFMIDGHGRAHPRRFGVACHLGLLLDRPTIGCAKSRLCGEETPPAPRRGATADLIHNGEVIGRLARTADGVRPVYASVGHRVTLEDAVRAILACATGFRVPEPTRLADQLVRRTKKEHATRPDRGDKGAQGRRAWGGTCLLATQDR